ncbi:MAG: hypothetical protein ACAI35_03895 [Candidatus Methylacidiphilales bacterium]
MTKSFVSAIAERTHNNTPYGWNVVVRAFSGSIMNVTKLEAGFCEVATAPTGAAVMHQLSFLTGVLSRGVMSLYR